MKKTQGKFPDHFKAGLAGALLCASAAHASGPPVAEGGNFNVGSNAYTPYPDVGTAAAIAENGSFVTGWTGIQGNNNGANLYLRQFAADGTPRGADFVATTLPSDGSHSIYNPSLATDANGNFIVTMIEDNVAMGRLFSSNGTALGAEFCLTPGCTLPGNQYLEGVRVGMDAAGNFVVLIIAQEYNPSNYTNVIQYRRFSANGTPLDTSMVTVVDDVGLHLYDNPVMNRSTGDFTVAWAQGITTWSTPAFSFVKTSIHFQRYDHAGVAQGSPVQVTSNSATLGSSGVWTGNAIATESATLDSSGNLAVVWTLENKSTSNVYVRRYSASGVAKGLGVRILANATAGWAAEDGKGNLIVPIYASASQMSGQAFDPNNKALGSPFTIGQVNGYVANNILVANPSGNFIDVFSSTPDITSTPQPLTITGQRYLIQ